MKLVLLCALVGCVVGGDSVLPEVGGKLRDNVVLVQELIKENGGSVNEVEKLLDQETAGIAEQIADFIGDGKKDLEHIMPILGGPGDPGHQHNFDELIPLGPVIMPVLGGPGDPDHTRPVFGGPGDPDHERPILGGPGDPDHEGPILGGPGDPDHERPVLGGPSDPDHERPVFGGPSDPDHERPILGGPGDPDHTRPVFGGKDDPDQENGLHDLVPLGPVINVPVVEAKDEADNEFDETKDWPGKFNRGEEEQEEQEGRFVPIPGVDPAKQAAVPDLCNEDPEDGGGSSRPMPLNEICKQVECPEFTAVKVHGACGFKARQYSPATWVITRIEQYDYGTAVTKLIKYSVSRHNKENVTMPFTLPIGFYTILSRDMSRDMSRDSAGVQAVFTAMYIPREFQENVPTPLDDSVFTKKIGSMLLYVRAFGSKDTQPDEYAQQYKSLAAAISKVGRKGVWNKPITFEYFNPHDWTPARHEVAFADSQSFDWN